MIAALILAAASPVPVACTDAADCTRRWDRAVQWVLERNPNIAEKNDTFLLTQPIERTGVDRYQLVRLASSIDMKMECANMFSCKLKKRRQEFADYVLAD